MMRFAILTLVLASLVLVGCLEPRGGHGFGTGEQWGTGASDAGDALPNGVDVTVLPDHRPAAPATDLHQ